MNKIRDFLLRALWQDPEYEVHQVSCPEITIDGIAEERYGKLLAEAQAAGAQFDGAKVSLAGLEFDWNYDGEAQVLHVTCTRKPFYASCGAVEAKIRELAAKAQGAL